MQWEFLKGAREYVLWLPAATEENGYLGEERSVISVWFLFVCLFAVCIMSNLISDILALFI